MAHHKIEFDCKCKACKGTGIYVGFAERDGAGVICTTCEGTGKCHVEIEYDDFIKKTKRKGITRVYETNPGFMLSGSFLSGGLDYDEWFAGTTFKDNSELRELVCPAWWYQSVDYKKKPKWCELWGGKFSDCEKFKNKEKCWKRFDEDQLKEDSK